MIQQNRLIRKRLRLQTQQSLAHAVNPDSADYLYWGNGKVGQPLVDAAYIAQALLTAPAALWQPLDELQNNVSLMNLKHKANKTT